MGQAEIRRQQVWSKTLRICHWGLALSVLILMASGWLISWTPERASDIDDIHFAAAAVLIAVLLVRLWLLFFGQGNDGLDKLLLNRHELRQAWEVIRAYLSLGKIPLPRWYAHNPLWAPLYLLLFIVLTVQIVSGLLLLNQVTLLGGLSLRQLHLLGFQITGIFTALHILASFFHDAKGSGSDISAMINGHRIFLVEPSQTRIPPEAPVVSLVNPDKSSGKE